VACGCGQAYKWTDDQCIFASGSPFPPYVTASGETKFTSQCNNMFIFPGIGLAVAVSQPRLGLPANPASPPASHPCLPPPACLPRLRRSSLAASHRPSF
jgi:hypothetical protein